MPKPNDSGLLSSLVTDFLTELAHANRSQGSKSNGMEGQAKGKFLIGITERP